jgi:DNA-directed RNA polymerase subunit alpha
LNPDLHIATIGKGGSLEMELTVERGVGYRMADKNKKPRDPIGVIPVDSIFSPVHRVRYRIENTRVGKLTNYDKLVLEIWTDGTVRPDDALVEASKIFRKHLNPFVQYGMPGAEIVPEEMPETPLTLPEPEPAAKLLNLKERLALPISDLDLSVRASNCLESENIKTIGDLVRLSEADLLAMKNFGKTSLREVDQKLRSVGLKLDLDVDALGLVNT